MGTPRHQYDSTTSEDVVGTLCIDGQPLTASDIEKTRSVRVARTMQTRRAVIAVAHFAHDRGEAAELLAMLGFDEHTVTAVRDQLREAQQFQTAKAS